MTPTKLLIAQRLNEVAAELSSIAGLADGFAGPEHHVSTQQKAHWHTHTDELRGAASLARWWATEILADAA